MSVPTLDYDVSEGRDDSSGSRSSDPPAPALILTPTQSFRFALSLLRLFHTKCPTVSDRIFCSID